VHIRELGYSPKFHKIHTLQCALPINMYNQQVFTFLWFWMVIMNLVNFIDMILWFFLFIPSTRRNFMLNYNINLDSYIDKIDVLGNFLKISSIENLNDYFYENLFEDFLLNYLSIDGIFIFKIISRNFGDFIAGELLHELIIKYIELKLDEKDCCYFIKFFPDSDFI
jgi:hypothetical protein